MYSYGARYYDPRFSIFVSMDPLVEMTMELYLYVGNNQIMFTDPTGMSKDHIIPSKAFLSKPFGRVHKTLMQNNKTYNSLLSKYKNSKDFNVSLYVNDNRKSPGSWASTEIREAYSRNKFVGIEAQTFYSNQGTENVSEIALAKTLIHEAIHLKISSEGNIMDDDSNHNYFANNYIDILKQGLMEHNETMKLGYSESQIEALSWEGNHQSDAFKTYINNRSKLNNSDYETEYNKWYKEIDEIRNTKKEQ